MKDMFEGESVYVAIGKQNTDVFNAHKIIFYETTITFSIADVINIGWVFEGRE